VLYHHRIRSKDGQFVHVEELTQALERLGHELVFVGPSATAKEEFGADGGLAAWLRRHVPAVLYELLEFSYAFLDYCRMSAAIRRHRPQVIYERYNLFLPSGVWAARRFRLPIIMEINSPLFEERSRFGGLALRRLARWSERTAWRGATFALPVTEVLADIVKQAGVDPDRLVVVPNGIDLAKFRNAPAPEEAKARLSLEGRFVLGFTGFMREWHRLDRVLDYMAGSSDRSLHLLIVGDGPARPQLEAHAERLGLRDRMTILGIVARQQVAACMAAFDIALQPAVVAYASPLKLFEYLAMGLPIVAPETSNIREVLRDAHNGVLFDPSSDGSFAAALQRVCSDRALRERLSQAARRTIEEQGLTWNRNAQRVTELMERACRHETEARCET
jgi:glycosyltransferase involved in cell wall biosynthesis